MLNLKCTQLDLVGRESFIQSVPWDGRQDALALPVEAPAGVVHMVLRAIKAEPTRTALRHALRRAEILTDDLLTRRVTERCENLDYSNAFRKALLRAE
jgi:hypothetical protein